MGSFLGPQQTCQYKFLAMLSQVFSDLCAVAPTSLHVLQVSQVTLEEHVIS